MSEELITKINLLEKKIEKLEAEQKDMWDGFDHGQARVYEIISELRRMTMASFFKTHPEFAKTLDQIDDIFPPERKG